MPLYLGRQIQAINPSVAETLSGVSEVFVRAALRPDSDVNEPLRFGGNIQIRVKRLLEALASNGEERSFQRQEVLICARGAGFGAGPNRWPGVADNKLPGHTAYGSICGQTRLRRHRQPGGEKQGDDSEAFHAANRDRRPSGFRGGRLGRLSLGLRRGFGRRGGFAVAAGRGGLGGVGVFFRGLLVSFAAIIRDVEPAALEDQPAAGADLALNATARPFLFRTHFLQTGGQGLIRDGLKLLKFVSAFRTDVFVGRHIERC